MIISLGFGLMNQRNSMQLIVSEVKPVHENFILFLGDWFIFAQAKSGPV